MASIKVKTTNVIFFMETPLRCILFLHRLTLLYEVKGYYLLNYRREMGFAKGNLSIGANLITTVVICRFTKNQIYFPSHTDAWACRAVASLARRITGCLE
jgi:hypothetical protein